MTEVNLTDNEDAELLTDEQWALVAPLLRGEAPVELGRAG